MYIVGQRTPIYFVVIVINLGVLHTLHYSVTMDSKFKETQD